MKQALIIIDMQNDFITGALANADAQKIVLPIANLAKNFDGDVIATRDTHTQDYLNTTEGKHLPIEHCIKDSDGWQIAEPIAKVLNGKNDVKYIDKPTFGYVGWDLSKYDEITMVGTCTDICVVSNALIIKATHPDLHVKIIANLCAGLTPQKHANAIDTMASCQVEII